MNNFFILIYQTLKEVVIQGYKEVKFTIQETKRLQRERKINEK